MLKVTTPEIENLIVSSYLQGKSIGQIASEVGRNRSVVAQTLLINCPETRTKAKADLINQIKAVGVNSTASLSANARRFNTDVLTIKAVFQDLGLPVPPHNTRKPQVEQQILELRQSGQSYRAIGKQLGISYERVRQILKRCGYKHTPKPPKPPKRPKSFTILK
jgi:hypothetical protein